MNATIQRVTERIQQRSKVSRSGYLARIRSAADGGPSRGSMSCSNLAHAMAAGSNIEKKALSGNNVPNIGIVSAYNEMLSARARDARRRHPGAGRYGPVAVQP